MSFPCDAILIIVIIFLGVISLDYKSCVTYIKRNQANFMLYIFKCASSVRTIRAAMNEKQFSVIDVYKSSFNWKLNFSLDTVKLDYQMLPSLCLRAQWTDLSSGHKIQLILLKNDPGSALTTMFG